MVFSVAATGETTHSSFTCPGVGAWRFGAALNVGGSARAQAGRRSSTASFTASGSKTDAHSAPAAAGTIESSTSNGDEKSEHRYELHDGRNDAIQVNFLWLKSCDGKRLL
jgi:hypothetical protein